MTREQIIDAVYNLFYLDISLEQLKNNLLAYLKQWYVLSIQNTDARILQYQKRQALGILTEDDENDYQQALEEYKEWTQWYNEKKEEIHNAETREKLEEILNNIL